MRTFVLLLAILAGPVRAEGVSDALRFVMVNGGYAEVPLVRLTTGHLAVEMRINGQRGLFLVDSGASQTVLDAERAVLYPLGPVVGRERVTGVAGARDVTGHRMQVYQVGPLSGEGALIYVADLGFVTGAIADLGGPVVDGVLGQDLLERHGAVLDMAGDRLFLRISGP